MPRTDITIPFDQWEASGTDDRAGRLYAEISINGYPMHLEAYAVEESGLHGVQGAADPAFEGCVDAMLEHFVEGAAQTVEINGREYLLVATPYQA